ncbi:hypothetical protein [Agromyces sp. Leaf222]|uniref:hypothetical protein n=1 Tax=Agromyces sp. Leaf222 TaxID=1735688 RepID=UPI0006FF8FA3|nr:hypothetical protein [Agromyces sp. Leaf222]KQM81945.1 hypothetical protein ASE68_00305 [Agromyces sp. Leaf222]
MTCTAATTEPMPGAQMCADLAARLPQHRARARDLLARAWARTIAGIRRFRMSRADARRDARPDPADARAAAEYYLSTHWVNR